MSPELLTLLATREFYSADLYTFKGGNLGSTVLRFCGGDTDLFANGLFYPSGGVIGPYFDRKDNKAKCHWKIGTQVDKLVVDILPGTYTLFGVPFAEVCRRGLLDFAEATLEKAFTPFGAQTNTSRGVVPYFNGLVGPIDAGRSIITMEIDSWLDILNLQIPKNVFQPPCGLNLGDAACGVDLVNGLNALGANVGPFKTTGTVTSGSSSFLINATLASTSFISGAFGLGKIVFSSGVLNGLQQTIKTVTFGSPSNIQLLGFFPTTPGIGDTFTIYFGCDKTSGLPFTATGNGIGGNPNLSNLSSTQGLFNGMVVTGTRIPTSPATTLVSFSGTSAVLSANATGSGAFSGTFNFASQNGCFKFTNTARYRGFKDIPQPALAV